MQTSTPNMVNKKSIDPLVIEDLKTKQVNLESIINQMKQEFTEVQQQQKTMYRQYMQ